MTVFGAIGLNGSGKDEVINYLHGQYNVPLISAGDIVREIAARTGIEATRDNLDSISRQHFQQFGSGYFLKLVIDRIRQNQWQVAGISGVRSPDDVRLLKSTFPDDFVLIHVYVTDPHTRYSRTVKRGAKRDAQGYEDFLRQDRIAEEMFHLSEATKYADFSMSNDSTLEDLHRRLDQLISEKKLLA